jgi:hypothetical protein
LYSFFSSAPDLRGAGFLWAKDLSAFDDFIKFGVDIPLLGGHLSLFTITAVITSLRDVEGRRGEDRNRRQARRRSTEQTDRADQYSGSTRHESAPGKG